MDRDNFDAIIKRYLEKFEYTNSKPQEEYFKWEAINTFQTHWDLEAPDMLEMFSRSTRELSVLIDTGKAAPTSGIKELLKKPEEVEVVRSAFRALYADDGGDLFKRQEKLEKFIETINERINHYWPGSHLYPQTMRSAICYLTMRYPAFNYLFFWTRANHWANCVEFGEDIGSGNHFSLATYYRMCDELRQEISKNEDLKACAQKRVNAAGSTFEDNYHTIVYDIIFCATAYNLYVDIPHYPTSTAARLQRAKERAELKIAEQEFQLAKDEYDRMLQSRPPVFDMTGREVKSKAFGMGVVVKHSETRESVKFQARIIEFIYPEAYNKKFLVPVSEGDRNAFETACKYDKDVAGSEKVFSVKEKEYSQKKDAFEKKWKKTAKAEIDFGDL